MERKAFIIRMADGAAALARFSGDVQACAKRNGVGNFSVWSIEDLLLCYGEQEDGGDAAGLRRPGGIPAASRKERK